MGAPEKTLLLIGCGKLGGALGEHYLKAGWRVVGARRDCSRLPEGFEALPLDIKRVDTLAALQTVVPDYVVVTLTPGERSAGAYREVFERGLSSILANLEVSRLKCLLFASSTSVYHQNDGCMVDENSPTEPNTFSGKSVLAAEQILYRSGLPVSCIRFGGIYGGDSLRLAERVREGRCAPSTPVHFSNRIHRQDCTRVLQHLIDLCEQGRPIDQRYLAVDDDAAPIAEVHQWLARELRVSYQVDVHYKHMAGSKRGDNRRLRESGFEFRFPDYRAGYSEVLSRAE